jgi:hypothetical protein
VSAMPAVSPGDLPLLVVIAPAAMVEPADKSPLRRRPCEHAHAHRQAKLLAPLFAPHLTSALLRRGPIPHRRGVGKVFPTRDASVGPLLCACT